MLEDVEKYFDNYYCVFKLVQMAINNISSDISNLKIDWRIVYTLAKHLSMFTLVKAGIDLLPKAQQPPEQALKAFNKEFTTQIIIDTNQIVELENIKKTFEKNKVDILLLKGSYMKLLYPTTYYRYMGDIDTFVESKDFEKSHQLLLKLGYNLDTDSISDRIYLKKPYICLEHHKQLTDNCKSNIGKYFNTVFSRCDLEKGCSHIYIMNKEDFYIYLLTHAVHHFNYAGIAPRIVLDFYVYLEKYKNSLNMEYIKDKLNEFGYSKFNDVIVELAYKWFSPNGSGLDKDSLIDKFIASCDTFGTVEHNIGIRTAKMSEQGKTSKFRFLLKQAFPSIESLKQQFAVLEKYPILLPIVWVKYIWRKATTSTTIGYYKNINSNTANKYQKIMYDLGINNIYE